MTKNSLECIRTAIMLSRFSLIINFWKTGWCIRQSRHKHLTFDCSKFDCSPLNVQAFANSRLDYYNKICIRLSLKSTQSSQLFKNTVVFYWTGLSHQESFRQVLLSQLSLLLDFGLQPNILDLSNTFLTSTLKLSEGFLLSVFPPVPQDWL